MEQNNKPFGYSYLLDMYDCKPGVADDLELHYRFLEKLVDKIGMTKMAPPIVIHAPRDKNGNEVYPDKVGVSAWVPLIESGIQIHSIEPTHFVTMDVYSCNNFDPNIVLQYAHECFGFARCDERFFSRGSENWSVLAGSKKMDMPKQETHDTPIHHPV
jgi:S-adenosylmethionine decarboxylase